ncbi:polysaccharide lyase family 8 super-sandwich domain-containing protein [Larkinella terrae]|uniref:Twin-arginine translocation signal domain-containing protein n=1 Tax=Larkinella terrae TaxID=2025311 RepID=A0A7K0EFN5_9BACT|nr:polysaccharide lyase family 8 super-sandwich domain-containing protein [Larkinella terrae]MRS60266.1 hypothetical protein [Larkinella terrae]
MHEVNKRLFNRRTFLKSTTGAVGSLGLAGPAFSLSQWIGTTDALPELALIRQRMADQSLVIAPEANWISVDQLLRTLDPTGHWPDLEAQFKPEHEGVKRYGHCTRILKLAGAFYAATGSQRTQLADALHRSLGVWLGKPHPPSAGWFYQIGSPLALGQAALIMGNELSASEKAEVVTILKTCVRPDGVLDYSGSPATGENLMHEATIQVMAGCLANDPAYVARYTKQAEQEIGPGRSESIQVDFSFHQHGPQFYSGGLYGLGFARDATALALALHKTAFAFAPDKLETLTRYVLDGLQPLTRGRSLDFTTVGRMVAWPLKHGPDHDSGFGAKAACDHLIPFGGKRQAELQAFARRLRGETEAKTAPAGNRLFWMSDYMAHNRPGFHASARMSSRRVYSHESGGKQNELGYHLGDGAMCLMQTGEEYRDIFPLWDWRRIPGVSCVYNPAVPLPLHSWGIGSYGGSDWAGGVSDGTSGAAAMEVHRGGLHALKAWFFLDEVVVCLGAAIKSYDSTLPVVTSVNQCWAKGPVTTSMNTAALAADETHTHKTAGWVHHDGVTYLFPQPSNLRIRTERKSAPWKTLNTAPHRDAREDPAHPPAAVEGEVFSLWIEHENAAKEGFKYSYVVAPGLAPSDIAAFSKTKSPTIVSNTPTLQAIATPDLVQGIFWKPGALVLPDQRKLEVDQPCIVQWRRTANGRWTLAVGNPTHRAGKVLVRVQDTVASAQPIVTTFTFPEGAEAGRSLVQNFPKA